MHAKRIEGHMNLSWVKVIFLIAFHVQGMAEDA